MKWEILLYFWNQVSIDGNQSKLRFQVVLIVFLVLSFFFSIRIQFAVCYDFNWFCQNYTKFIKRKWFNVRLITIEILFNKTKTNFFFFSHSFRQLFGVFKGLCLTYLTVIHVRWTYIVFSNLFMCIFNVSFSFDKILLFMCVTKMFNTRLHRCYQI